MRDIWNECQCIGGDVDIANQQAHVVGEDLVEADSVDHGEEISKVVEHFLLLLHQPILAQAATIKHRITSPSTSPLNLAVDSDAPQIQALHTGAEQPIQHKYFRSRHTLWVADGLLLRLRTDQCAHRRVAVLVDGKQDGAEIVQQCTQ